MRARQPLRLLAAAVAVTLLPVLAAPATPALAADVPAPTIVQVTDPATLGKPARFRLRAPAGEVAATGFRWQLNAGPWQEVAASGGRATVTLVPSRFTNTLAAYAIGADGSPGETSQVIFSVTVPPPAADQDLDGDGRADLLTPGGTAGLGEGLWLAAGRGDRGRVRVPAVDLGSHGAGAGWESSGADFTGAQVVTGKFTGGPFEDVFVYYPAGYRAGTALIIKTLGNGAELRPDLDGVQILPAGLLSDWDGNQPLQLVNGYDADGGNPEYPDLFGILGNPATGYGLSFYPVYGGSGSYPGPVPTGVPTPAGGTDWQNWRLASASLPGGTAIVLWNKSTGALHLWQSVTVNPDTGALTYQAALLSAGWLPGAELSTLQLADFDADGIPDLRTVGTDGRATAYRVTGLSATGPATITARAPQPLG